MAHSTNTLLDEVKSITECPICQEVMTTPKVLPCLHTFCLKCIEKHGKGHKEGSSILCPMCRANFTVPCGGMSGLKNNFFIEKLIVSQTSSNIGRDGTNCDVCFSCKSAKVSATGFCVECQENLCEQCSLIHSNMKLTKSHEIQSLTANPEMVETPNEKCELHDIDIQQYCKNCKSAVCIKCVDENHKKHDCEDILETIKKLKRSLEANCDDIRVCELNIRKQSEEADERFRSFTNSDAIARTQIEERSQGLKLSVDEHVAKAIKQLDLMGYKIKIDFKNKREDMQRKRHVLLSFVQYSTELLKKASPVDIIRVADEMKSKAQELKKTSVGSFDKFPRINFIPSAFQIQIYDIRTSTNIIGRIRVVKELDKSVQGLTASITSLCVLYNESPDIELYDTKTLALQKTIHVPGLNNPCDIVHSNDLLFVSDDEKHLMHKIQFPGGTVVRQWKITGNSLKLSIVQPDKLAVCSCDPIEIIEYTFEGKRLRTIKLPTTFSWLYHAIFLKDNVYVACVRAISKRGDSQICFINISSTQQSEIQQSDVKCAEFCYSLKVPCFLSIDKAGSVLVADKSSITKLNQINLMNEKVILDGLKRPYTFCLQEEVHCIYVCDCSNTNKISMFDYT